MARWTPPKNAKSRFLSVAIASLLFGPSGLATPPSPEAESGVADRRRDPFPHRELAPPETRARRHLATKALRARYGSFGAITPADNERFIALSRHQSPGLTVYLSENAVLKELNDKVIGDYDLVTALCNAHKSIVHELIMADPTLRAALVAPYHDFKGIAFAFRGDSFALRRALRLVHRQAGESFAELVRHTAVSDLLADWRGIAGDPRHFHAGGIGTSYDEAGAAARLVRTRYASHKRAGILEFQRVEPWLDANLKRVEQLRQAVTSRVDRRLLKRIPGSLAYTLDVDAVDILRKARSVRGGLASYLTHVRIRLSQTYGVGLQLQMSDLLLLRDYFATTDGFSAGLLLAKRVEIDLSGAQHNILSLDFKGQGARNHFETQVGLYRARNSGARAALKEARAAEARATVAMDRVASGVDGVLGNVYPESTRDDDLASGRTGDDKRYATQRGVRASDRRNYLSGLATRDFAAMLRSTDVSLSFADSGAAVPPAERAVLVNTAEGVLKKMEGALEGPQAKPELKAALLHLRLYPQSDGHHQLALSVGGKLSPQSLALLGRSLAAALPAQLKLRGRIEQAERALTSGSGPQPQTRPAATVVARRGVPRDAAQRLPGPR